MTDDPAHPRRRMTAPLKMAEAADALGICKRSLTTYVQDFEYYEQRGARKVFYPEHIMALREAIDKCSKSKPILQPASGKLAAPSGASVLERARRRATEKRRRGLQRQSNANTGSVVPLERPR